MHSALFVATISKDKPDWVPFLQNVDLKLKRISGVMRLAENIWLLNLTMSAAGLGALIHHAESLGIEYGILPFAEEPRWLPAGYNPKPTRGRSEP